MGLLFKLRFPDFVARSAGGSNISGDGSFGGARGGDDDDNDSDNDNK